LLYVGMSRDPLPRFHAHKSSKPEWRQIAEIRIEWHESRSLALAAEMAAIRSEQPEWNRFHTPRHHELALRTMQKQQSSMSDGERWEMVDSLLKWHRNRQIAAERSAE
jgi:hypothetical protein